MLDFSKQTQLDFLEWVRGGEIEIHHLEQWELGGIREKMDKYSDLPANFANATLLEVAESRNIENIITIDRDFTTYRLKKERILKNLLQ